MVHESLNNKSTFDNDRFYMWRCITAMAHADGIVDDTERSYLKNVFSNMLKKGSLTEEAHKTLQNDIETPRVVSTLLKHIKNPTYHSQIIYFARLLAYQDGELHPSEKLLLHKLRIEISEDKDLASLKKQVIYDVQKETVQTEVQKDSKRANKGLSGLIDQIALAFNVDLMD